MELSRLLSLPRRRFSNLDDALAAFRVESLETFAAEVTLDASNGDEASVLLSVDNEFEGMIDGRLYPHTTELPLVVVSSCIIRRGTARALVCDTTTMMTIRVAETLP